MIGYLDWPSPINSHSFKFEYKSYLDFQISTESLLNSLILEIDGFTSLIYEIIDLSNLIDTPPYESDNTFESDFLLILCWVIYVFSP